MNESEVFWPGAARVRVQPETLPGAEIRFQAVRVPAMDLRLLEILRCWRAGLKADMSFDTPPTSRATRAP